MEVRRLIQWVSALIHNANIKGFATLTIYQGAGKGICVPVLNCYSCPGAIGSCPVGSVQASLGSLSHRIFLYVAGIVALSGILGGRWVCGWLCPFGLVQELLAGVRKNKIKLPAHVTLIKYPILLLTLLLPIFWVSQAGVGGAYYCQYICPAGTFEAGLPLGLGIPALRDHLGTLFIWKGFILLLVVILSLFVFRPFCRILCPLGAFYGLFNPISIWRLDHMEGCISCGTCRDVCPMGIDISENLNSPECIRCMRCRDACPNSVLRFSAKMQKIETDILQTKTDY